MRLFEPTGRRRNTTLRCPSLGVEYKLTLRAFELRTLRLDLEGGTVTETNLLEEPR